MAKVLLLDSPSWALFDPAMHLNLAILYLAGSLREKGHEVKVLDCHRLTSWDRVANKLIIHEELLEEADVVGFSSTTANLNYGQELAGAWTKAKVKVLGGPHATHILNGPHDRFKTQKYFQGFDYVMTGEAEESFTAFCDTVDRGEDLKKSRVPGLAWFNEFGLQHNPDPVSPDVTKLPGPAFDLWVSGFNKGGLAGPTTRADNAGQKLTASTYSTRGCPYACTFCSDARTKLREETIEQVEKEIKQLATLGVQAIRIQDDTYSIKKDRAKRIADIMYDYGMQWRATTRVNLVDRDLFEYLASKGCTELGFGVEHGSAKMLKAMAKGTTPEKNAESLKACADAGIVARAFFMIGFPGETEETIAEMTEWILRVRPSACTVSLFQPFPGSDVFNRPEKYGVSIPDDAFSRMWQLGMDDDPSSLVLELPTISREELFKQKKQLIKAIESNIGSLDRRQMHGNLGTFGPAVQDMGLASEGCAN